MAKNPATKHSPSHMSRKAEAQSRPGVRSIMAQGSTGRAGDAEMVGDTRGIMRNGGHTPKVTAVTSKLRGIMGQ